MIVYYIIYMLVPCSFLATEFHFTFDATAIVGLHEFALSERISGHFLGQSTEKHTNICGIEKTHHNLPKIYPMMI